MFAPKIDLNKLRALWYSYSHDYRQYLKNDPAYAVITALVGLVVGAILF